MVYYCKTKVLKMSEEWPDKPIDVSDKDMNDFLDKYPIAVVDFWASWCGPCKMMGPVIDQLAQEMTGDMVFGKLNVDENNTMSAAFNISSIPTLVVFKDGKEVHRISGAMPKDALKGELQKFTAP